MTFLSLFKSLYRPDLTVLHSVGTSAFCYAVAKFLGMDEGTCRLFAITGLLGGGGNDLASFSRALLQMKLGGGIPAVPQPQATQPETPTGPDGEPEGDH